MTTDKATIWRRLRVRFCGYGPLLPGLRVAKGITLLSTANDGSLMLVTRHPAWSVTWLWFVRLGWGADRSYLPWWKRFRFFMHRSPPGAATSQGQAWLYLGWCSVSYHWQPEMAKPPGRQGYDRGQWLRYCKKWARIRGAQAAEEAYRAELARMLEPSPQDELA